MNNELISKKTRYEFREFLVGWTLREIEMEFDAADIPCCSDYHPPVSGARRSFVEQYYKSLGFTDWNDVRKLLKVYENILNTISERNPEVAANLCKWLKKDGFVYQDGRIVPITGIPTLTQVKTIAIEFEWKGLKPRHAKLAAGAATTLVVFMFETHKETQHPS